MSHEDYFPHSGLWDHPRRMHDDDGDDWRILAALVAFLASVILCCVAACALSGCAADAPAVADLGKHTAGALAGGAKPGSYAAGAAVALAGAESGAEWLAIIGGLALVAGGVCLGHPQGPNGVGFGLLVAAVLCLFAGAVLPLLAGWVGLAVLGLVLAAFAASKFGLFSRIQNLTSNLLPSSK